jgi:hypothetical protein
MKEIAIAGLRKQVMVRAVLLQERLQYIGWGGQRIVPLRALANSEARRIAKLPQAISELEQAAGLMAGNGGPPNSTQPIQR